jgi:hypothetical protein
LHLLDHRGHRGQVGDHRIAHRGVKMDDLKMDDCC